MAKKAVVTGATRGIGAAITQRLIQDGFEVIGIARHVPSSFPGEFHQCDLNDLENSRAVFSRIGLAHDVSILINNVGAVAVESVADITTDALSYQWRVNVEAAVLAIQALLPSMRRQRFGRVINIASGALLGKIGRTGYAASKAALVGLTRTMAMELGPSEVTVNCIAPGQIGTQLWATNNDPDSPKTKAMVESIPLRRLGTPDDVAGAVAFFASESASYVTGQTLFVCGGLTVGRSTI